MADLDTHPDDKPAFPAEQEASSEYIDYLAFLSPTFSPYKFANQLVLETNTVSDPTLDLSTPLSRVLFDLQEIDSHIHNLTSSSALDLLIHAKQSQETSSSLLGSLESELQRLTETYKRLEQEVIQRSDSANEILMVVERLHETTSLLRQVTRALLAARQFESHMLEVRGHSPVESGRKLSEFDMIKAMPKAAYAAVETYKMLFSTKREKKLDDIDVIRALKKSYVQPSVTHLTTKAQNIVSAFTLSAAGSSQGRSLFTGSIADETKLRLSSAFDTLHLLSIYQSDSPLLMKAIQSYINIQSTAILGAFSRGALTNPTQLDSTLVDLRLRTQNILFIEVTLQSIPLPSKSQTITDDDDDTPPSTLLSHILNLMSVPTLPTAFFQTMAPGLEKELNKLVSRGGANARLVRQQKPALKDGLRDAVREALSDAKLKRSDAEIGICVGLLSGALNVLGK